jgi:6-phospho-3-hexuloisomerase
MHPDIEQILREMADILGRVTSDSVAIASKEVRGAQRVFVYGLGRTGLICRAFAMRLMHLGLTAHVVGDATTPAIGAGDVLVACSGTGTTGVVLGAARKAQHAGARVLAVTGAPDTPLATAADAVAIVPAKPSSQQQFGGSPFEQALLVFLDAVILDLTRQLGVSHQDMWPRHANLP